MVALLGGVFVIKNSIEVGDIQLYSSDIRTYCADSADRTGYQTGSPCGSIRAAGVPEEPEESQNEKQVRRDIEKLIAMREFEHVKFGYNPDKIINGMISPAGC